MDVLDARPVTQTGLDDRTLTPAELETLLACIRPGTALGLRDLALFSLITDTHLPCHVLLAMTEGDLLGPDRSSQLGLPHAWHLLVPSRAEDTPGFAYPLRPQAAHIVALWRDRRQRMGPGPCFWMLGSGYARGAGRRLSFCRALRIFNRLAKQAGIRGSVVLFLLGGAPR